VQFTGNSLKPTDTKWRLSTRIFRDSFFEHSVTISIHFSPFLHSFKVLEKYLKKSTKSSSSTLFHHYPTGSYSTTPTMKPLQHTYSTTSGMPHLVRPSGFSPYYIPPPPPPSSQAPSHHMVRIDIFTLRKSFTTKIFNGFSYVILRRLSAEVFRKNYC